MHALLLGLILQGDVPKDAALEGTWVIESAVANGKAREVKGEKITFKNGKWTASPSKESETYKIDPTKKPKTIDLAQGRHGGVYWGIYKLERDKLTLCIPEEPSLGRRPAEFTSKEGEKQMLIELKREKK